ncbi:MAG: hypothetical protein AVDCRST_MAG59-4964 [uncultured Thermomicrobiales bacterium]|uniref:Uncharacterized protein n=1 Tax=uncultured Thermomicrobiales bacterium TaxID=1645740 RepID=A0A6J4VLB5_9BACT|nr:MAG: hypothetical protein AVDCRST_MAG59-4964 [uncultured Thermomicrobiales bacterium]
MRSGSRFDRTAVARRVGRIDGRPPLPAFRCGVAEPRDGYEVTAATSRRLSRYTIEATLHPPSSPLATPASAEAWQATIAGTEELSFVKGTGDLLDGLYLRPYPNLRPYAEGRMVARDVAVDGDPVAPEPPPLHSVPTGTPVVPSDAGGGDLVLLRLPSHLGVGDRPASSQEQPGVLGSRALRRSPHRPRRPGARRDGCRSGGRGWTDTSRGGGPSAGRPAVSSSWQIPSSPLFAPRSAAPRSRRTTTGRMRSEASRSWCGARGRWWPTRGRSAPTRTPSLAWSPSRATCGPPSRPPATGTSGRSGAAGSRPPAAGWKS